LERGQHVAVHCRQTLGRSGRIAAAVLAHAGIDPELAIEVVSSARGQAVPETPEQRLWLQLAPSAPPILLKAES
jgi:protein-tyrosine phosphatase